ncbi:unnamed protein product [Brassica rapa]|uniref:BPM/SPOP BACK domain-containing protein n=1 Tax=Brassica campestris TaxID=3711 RepID=A0A8D9H384_BRACM|nr:unnamed protein product [Brassica rapa]
MVALLKSLLLVTTTLMFANARYISSKVVDSTNIKGYKRFFRRTGLESSDYLKDNSLLVRCRVAVMQTDGFDYLKRSCPSLLTELLEYVARRSEHSVIALGHRKEVFADGCDANGRRVKQRLH